MPKITINKDKCKGCQLCILYCPKGQIVLSKELNKRGVQYAVFRDEGNCTGCTFCALICPDLCVEVYK